MRNGREGGTDSIGGVSTRGISKGSGMSRFSPLSAAQSMVSVAGSICLSEKEVIGMKRLLSEKDRKSRQENFIIKGVKNEAIEKGTILEWSQALISDWLKEYVKIVQARVSGNVIVARVGNVEEKNVPL